MSPEMIQLSGVSIYDLPGPWTRIYNYIDRGLKAMKDPGLAGLGACEAFMPNILHARLVLKENNWPKRGQELKKTLPFSTSKLSNFIS